MTSSYHGNYCFPRASSIVCMKPREKHLSNHFLPIVGPHTNGPSSPQLASSCAYSPIDSQRSFPPSGLHAWSLPRLDRWRLWPRALPAQLQLGREEGALPLPVGRGGGQRHHLRVAGRAHGAAAANHEVSRYCCCYC